MTETSGKFECFKVRGLRGKPNLEVNIRDNVLILVGENGAGKTTLLRMMFYFLSGKFRQLLQFKFDVIEAELDGVVHYLSYEQLESAYTVDIKLLNRLSPSTRMRIKEAQANGRLDEVTFLLDRYYDRGYPNQNELPFDEASFGRLSAIQDAVRSSLKAQILYLPTYRRIERELSTIFEGADEDGLRRLRKLQQTDTEVSYIELVEFGMGDVEKALSKNLEDIRKFSNDRLHSLTLSYLGDIVGKEYENLTSVDEFYRNADEVSKVLNRVSNEILNQTQKREIAGTLTKKTHLSELSVQEKIIHHYFTKLLKFHSELQNKEQNIARFCDICSDYISDKQFVYDSRRFEFHIQSTGSGDCEEAEELDFNDRKDDLRLSDLSSGEKQIVSLFSHLYLSGVSKFFVLIDEPELSLSVPWQRRFLQDIKNGAFCTGVVAVTHSPFIYDNELRPYARAIGEFVKGEDWGNIDVDAR
ncbi:AAA family ATPase [Asticcacaulis sp.]|uniref:AAA family ATPase n=1 Tax=Asticcacaulis sp. TaxID=1872648 RepID=UPI0031D4477F